jgi:hypothetical protein
MQLNDTAISLIRTWVPIAVGAVIAWLATAGLELDIETQTALVIGLTGLIQGAYYALVRIIEKRFPQVGWLLGKAKTPNYTPVDEIVAQAKAEVLLEMSKPSAKKNKK